MCFPLNSAPQKSDMLFAIFIHVEIKSPFMKDTESIDYFQVISYTEVTLIGELKSLKTLASGTGWASVMNSGGKLLFQELESRTHLTPGSGRASPPLWPRGSAGNDMVSETWFSREGSCDCDEEFDQQIKKYWENGHRNANLI